MDADRLLEIAAELQPKRGAGRKTILREHDIFVEERSRCALGKPLTKLLVTAQEAQHLHHNREVAGTADFQLRKPRENIPQKVSKGCGSGRWKQRTQDEVLRIAFSRPAMTSRSVAQTLKPPPATGMSGECCIRVQPF
jgi:hypothetical protein